MHRRQHRNQLPVLQHRHVERGDDAVFDCAGADCGARDGTLGGVGGVHIRHRDAAPGLQGGEQRGVVGPAIVEPVVGPAHPFAIADAEQPRLVAGGQQRAERDLVDAERVGQHLGQDDEDVLGRGGLACGIAERAQELLAAVQRVLFGEVVHGAAPAHHPAGIVADRLRPAQERAIRPRRAAQPERHLDRLSGPERVRPGGLGVGLFVGMDDLRDVAVKPAGAGEEAAVALVGPQDAALGVGDPAMAGHGFGQRAELPLAFGEPLGDAQVLQRGGGARADLRRQRHLRRRPGAGRAVVDPEQRHQPAVADHRHADERRDPQPRHVRHLLGRRRDRGGIVADQGAAGLIRLRHRGVALERPFADLGGDAVRPVEPHGAAFGLQVDLGKGDVADAQVPAERVGGKLKDRLGVAFAEQPGGQPQHHRSPIGDPRWRRSVRRGRGIGDRGIHPASGTRAMAAAHGAGASARRLFVARRATANGGSRARRRAATEKRRGRGGRAGRPLGDRGVVVLAGRP